MRAARQRVRRCDADAGAALLDAGVIVDQTIGRRGINLLNPAARVTRARIGERPSL